MLSNAQRCRHPKHQRLSSLKTTKDINACLESFQLFSINGGTRNQVNHRFPASVPWASRCYLGFTMATRTEEIGRTETGQKCKKVHFDTVPTNFAVLLTSPLAVYAKPFSSSSIRDKFSKSAFRPKDYCSFSIFPTQSPEQKLGRVGERSLGWTDSVSCGDIDFFFQCLCEDGENPQRGETKFSVGVTVKFTAQTTMQAEQRQPECSQRSSKCEQEDWAAVSD